MLVRILNPDSACEIAWSSNSQLEPERFYLNSPQQFSDFWAFYLSYPRLYILTVKLKVLQRLELLFLYLYHLSHQGPPLTRGKHTAYVCWVNSKTRQAHYNQLSERALCAQHREFISIVHTRYYSEEHYCDIAGEDITSEQANRPAYYPSRTLTVIKESPFLHTRELLTCVLTKASTMQMCKGVFSRLIPNFHSQRRLNGYITGAPPPR